MKNLVLLMAATSLFACKSAEPAAVAEEPIAEARPAGGAPSAEATPAPPIIMTDDAAEHRVSPSGKAVAILLAQGNNAYFGKLTMAAGAAVPKHRDATEEYIYILEGSGVITIDGKEHKVGPNTVIYMPANAEVSFQNGAQKLVGLQVFAGPEPAAKYDAWTR